jgi:agmatine deiminase
MPPEWAGHEATWMAWPKNPETFPASMIGKVEGAYCGMIAALSSGEKVKLLVDDEKEEERVEKVLSKAGSYSSSVLFCRIKTSDVWVRDYGPTFLISRGGGKKAAVKWIFNAWGNKYGDLALDDGAGEMIAQRLEKDGIAVFRPGIVMEGGSIEADGDGTVITTEQCLLNKNRNQNLGREQIEGFLKDYLGAKRIIWLKEGIEGDDTDGHVDDFARLVSKNTVICAKEKNKNDANSARLEKNASLLSSSGFEVAPLPMPAPITDPIENRRLPASYANFYIANKCVLLPVFGSGKDKEAAEVLQSCFPGREVIPVRANELVYGYGGIHCVTQQEPK